MSRQEFIYIYNEKQYKVIVTRKKMRSIRYRYKDGTFKISAPYLLVSQKQIIDGLNKYAPKLIEMDARTHASGDGFMYLLGTKIAIKESGEINFDNGEKIVYKSQEDLNRKLKKWFQILLEKRTRYYEKVMGIKKPYKVRVRKMTSRYGSNASGTHSITYSMLLIHYTTDVIDSVIVHELAHDAVKNHSQKFYDVVYKYCPNYKELHRRLRKGEFHG